MARAGADVSLIARGPHLAAMRENGLTLRSSEETLTVHPRVTDDPAPLGPQDYVVITLKAHQVPDVVGPIQSLLGPATAVVMAVNGVPWWYFYGLGGAYDGRRLSSVDPGNMQWAGIGPQRVIGCVVYPAAEMPEPGVIELVEGDRFTLGEPSGKKTERTVRLSRALIAAGLKAPIRTKIRDEIWIKLWGNLSFNPISALTCATIDVICSEPGTRALARSMMIEAQAIAEKLGVRFPISVDKRLDGGAAVGAPPSRRLSRWGT